MKDSSIGDCDVRKYGGGYAVRFEVQEEIDMEWAQLIKEALEIGITKEEILEFLQTAGKIIS